MIFKIINHFPCDGVPRYIQNKYQIEMCGNYTFGQTIGSLKSLCFGERSARVG